MGIEIFWGLALLSRGRRWGLAYIGMVFEVFLAVIFSLLEVGWVGERDLYGYYVRIWFRLVVYGEFVCGAFRLVFGE